MDFSSYSESTSVLVAEVFWIIKALSNPADSCSEYFIFYWSYALFLSAIWLMPSLSWLIVFFCLPYSTCVNITFLLFLLFWLCWNHSFEGSSSQTWSQCQGSVVYTPSIKDWWMHWSLFVLSSVFQMPLSWQQKTWSSLQRPSNSLCLDIDCIPTSTLQRQTIILPHRFVYLNTYFFLFDPPQLRVRKVNFEFGSDLQKVLRVDTFT